MKNITIRIQKELHKKLKIKLTKEETDISKLLRKFIKSYVEDENISDEKENNELRWDA